MAILAPVKWFKQFETTRQLSVTSQLTFEQRVAKRRETEALQQAEENGVFTSISREFVINNFVQTSLSPSDDKYNAVVERAISLLRVIILSEKRVRQIDYLGYCTGLQVIDLSTNFVSGIDPLIGCHNLIKLDIHSNQIATLPGPEFWSQLTELQILYLHDNPLANLRSVVCLSACPRLTMLTLYGTPLCLRPYYRHQVVNTIFSLKALDRFVVSDQEIIEGAAFGSRFAAFGPQFAVGPMQPVKAGEELQCARRLLRQINHILAHHSPVVMMQRYVRGHLARRRLGCTEDAHLWAAVMIQRAYRDWKHRRTGQLVGTSAAPPPSPCELDSTTDAGAESVKLDFDTYLKSRRPDSVATERPHRVAYTAKHDTSGPPAASEPPGLHIDLDRLQQTVLRSCGDMPARRRQSYLSTGPPTPPSPPPPRQSVTRRDRRPPTSGRIEDSAADDTVPFRLSGIRAPTAPRTVSSTTLRAERKREADVVRQVKWSNHDEASQAAAAAVVARRRSDGDVVTASRRRPARLRGDAAPWLACLESVSDEYRRAEAEQRAAALRAEVRQRREARDGARAAATSELDRKRSLSVFVEETDRRALTSALAQRDAARRVDAESRSEARRRAADVISSRRQSGTFADDVARRMGACSRAHVLFVQQEQQDARCRLAASMIQRQREERRERDAEVERVVEARRQAVAKQTDLDKFANDVARLQQLVNKQVQAHERVKAAKEAAAAAGVPGARRKRLTLPIVSNPQ